MDKELVKAASDTAKTIAIQLWPTMLFLVVMTLIGLLGAWILTDPEKNPISRLMAFWFWFVSNGVITGFGIRALVIDTRIHAAAAWQKINAATAKTAET